VLFGVVLVVSCGSIARSVSDNRVTAIAGLVLVALSYDVINLSSARYDVMTAALAALSLATYLRLRERSLDRALAVANAFLAAACLTHPYALFGMVGLATFVLMLDRQRIRWRHVAIGAAPYLVALIAWGAYIAQDPVMFRAQFAENAGGRVGGLADPLAIVLAEIRVRYLELFAGWRPNAPPMMRVKILLLLAYVGGIIGCLALERIRRNAKARALLAYALISVVLLAVVESHRWYVYFIHLLPQVALCLALVAGEMFRRRGWPRRAAISGVVAYAMFAVATVAYRARLDVHGQAFLPAVSYLRARIQPGDLVMAGGEFGVGLDFERHVLDDSQLGYRNARRPAYFVLSTERLASLELRSAQDARFKRHIDSLMVEYRLAFESSAGMVRYQVFERQSGTGLERSRGP
jgi:hypothetical protein